MIIKESEIRDIIKKEIIKKAQKSRLKTIVDTAIKNINERKAYYTSNSDIISEIYGDSSYTGKSVSYGDSPYEGSQGQGTQAAKPSEGPPPGTSTSPAAAAPATRKSGLKYSSSEKFPIKKGDKDPSGSSRIKDLQSKLKLTDDGMYGPKTEAKVNSLHGVKVVSEELYNKIMGAGGSVDVTSSSAGSEGEQLGTGGAPRQVTRQASGGKYRIKKKKSGTIKIDPTGGMERTIKSTVVDYMTRNDPANARAHKKIKVGRIFVDLQNPNVDDFGEEEFMSANVRMKGDLGRLPAIGKGREASTVIKKAVWKGLKAAGILEA